MTQMRGWLICLTILWTGVAAAEPDGKDGPRPAHSTGHLIQETANDAKDYVLAPLHWERGDWLFLGSAIAATAAAHAYDRDVRDHFLDSQSASGTHNSEDIKDAALPLAALIGTAAYAGLTRDRWGRRETWSMLEAAGLGGVTSYALKFAAGRQRPAETLDANAWREGASAFPSMHVTAAFAIGGVLAESGNDEYRWVRRALGYGIGAATAYGRIKHNAHWLSDTVAGAAVGLASAQFVMHRRDSQERERLGSLMLMPADGGLILNYHRSF